MKYIRRYCDKILREEIRSCEEQKKLCRLVLSIFENEDLKIDEEKVEKYFGLQKYFRYELFDWEKFCFVLHCCVYRADGFLRFPDMFIYVGRGSGKNGYTSFEDFALLSPVNGIRNYNIQSFAAAEANAKTSHKEIKEEVIELNMPKLSRFFKATEEYIRCTKTNSVLTYHTSRPTTKDGGRPGKINLDEVHVFENTDLIDVARGGLGKVADARVLITTTDGYIRDGPLDGYKAKSIDILDGSRPDNGFLPFICRLKKDEIDDPENWIMAVPSLGEFPNLRHEMEKDHEDYKADPIGHSAFAVKRCNCPDVAEEGSLTSWDNILACCKGEMPGGAEAVQKRPCIICFDYSTINDFMSAGIITLSDGIFYFEQKTWICKQSCDLYRIRFPLREAVSSGDAEFVDGTEIPPELPVIWVKEHTIGAGKRIIAGAADSFRFSYLRRACREMLGLDSAIRMKSNNYGKMAGFIYMNRPSDLMKSANMVTTVFNNHKLYCGDSKLMRWYLGNVKVVIDKNGNTHYEKIEPKSRKTDGAMCLLAGMTLAEMLLPYDRISQGKIELPGVRVYGKRY